MTAVLCTIHFNFLIMIKLNNHEQYQFTFLAAIHFSTTYVRCLYKCKLVSPWPACLDDVTYSLVVGKSVVTIVVSGPTVQTNRYLLTKMDTTLYTLNNI